MALLGPKVSEILGSFFFFKGLLLLLLIICTHVYLWVDECRWVLAEPKRSSDLGTEVTGDCDPSDEDAGI